MIQKKIDEIMNNVKIKNEFFSDELIKKDFRIRQLQYKLKKRQGKQVSVQTAGFKNKFKLDKENHNLQEIQQQHRIIVQTLKRNLQNNQRQLLHTQADLKSLQEKLKKKDLQSGNLTGELDRLKKQLKEEKEKNLASKAQWQGARKSMSQQKLPTEPKEIIQESKVGTPENITEEEIKSNVKGNKKRKNKYSILGGLMAGALNSSNAIKNKQDIIMEQEIEVHPQDKRISTFASLTKSGFNKTTSSNQSNHSVALQTNQNIDPLNQFLNNLQENQHKSHHSQSNSKVQSHNNVLPQTSISRNLFKKSSQSNNILNNLSNDKAKLDKQGSVKNTENLSQKDSKDHSSQRLSSLESQYKLNIISQAQECSKQLEEAIQPLLQKNAQIMWNLLFCTQNHLDYLHEITNLKEYLTKYDQPKLYQKLKRIQGLMVHKQQPNCKFNDKGKLKEIQQEKIISNEMSYKSFGSHPTQNDRQWTFPSQNYCPPTEQAQIIFQNQLPNEQNNQERSRKVLTNNTNASKSQHLRSVKLDSKITAQNRVSDQNEIEQPQSFKRRDDRYCSIKRTLPSKSYLKKLHEKIRINGQGFNLSKKQFFEICQKVNTQQAEQDGRSYKNNTQFTQSSDDQRPQESKTQKFIKKSTRKQTDFRQERLASTSKTQLKIEGTAIDIPESPRLTSNEKQNKSNGLCSRLDQNQGQFREKTICSKFTHMSKAEKQSVLPKIVDIPFVPLCFDDKNNSSTKAVIKQSRQLYELYDVIKKQGGKVESTKEFEEMLESNELNLQDIVKITQLLKSEKPEEIYRLFSKCSNHEHSKTVKASSCCSHMKKYSSFLQKLCLNQSAKRFKKDLFSLNIFNIDGKDQAQKPEKQTKADFTSMQRKSVKKQQQPIPLKQSKESKLKKQAMSLHADSSRNNKTRQKFLPELNRKIR